MAFKFLLKSRIPPCVPYKNRLPTKIFKNHSHILAIQCYRHIRKVNLKKTKENVVKETPSSIRSSNNSTHEGYIETVHTRFFYVRILFTIFFMYLPIALVWIVIIVIIGATYANVLQLYQIEFMNNCKCSADVFVSLIA